MSDLIDRQAAITQLSHNKNKGDDEWELAVESDIQTIWKLPSAQPTFDARDTQYNLPIGTDLISRAQAIEALSKANGVLYWNNTLKASLIKLINEIPSKESESFEWCTDCKEYDQETHCCHRWSKMIRKTVDEMQIVRCKDCKYAEYIDDVKTLWCTECGQGRTVSPYDFCSYGERR